MRHRYASFAALATVLLFTACREAKVAHYRVPKEKPPELPPGMNANPGADMASTAVPTAQGAGLTWTAPADWKAKPASAMRRGSYDVRGADLSITAFPGDVGGELANLNRWRGQIQLPPLTADDLPSATTTLTVGSLDFIVVDFANPSAENSQRILGALASFGGNTWFIKLTGPDAVVAAAKPAFLDFLQTVKTPPAGAPAPTDMASTAVPTAQGDGLAWTAPAHWETKAPSAMRRGSYTVTGADGASADMSITAFPGDVGGELANLNRWRGQIQLPPLTADELPSATTTLKVGSLDFIVVDFAGTSAENPQRILGALVSFDDNTWFFKLMGPDAVVAAAKPAFLDFLQTVKTPAAGAAAPTDMASTAVPTAQGDGLTWTAPAHWETKASSAMRRGSYAVTGTDGASADMSITAFPGDVGGELANLNRWRGQILLPPLSESALSANTTTLKVGSLDFTVVDFTSTTSSAPERILGALVSFEGNTWFFKLKGPAQLVEANKSAFLQLLQSVKTP